MVDLRHGLAGGIAGIAVDLVFYPLETIKTRIMASSQVQNFRTIAVSKFRGFSCQMLVSFPYACTFFYVYETIRAGLRMYRGRDVAASMLAEVVANLVRNPFEVVKQQLMTGRAHQASASVIQIVRKRGILGLYVGLQATLARDILFSAIQMPLFEIFKEANPLHLSPLFSASLGGSLAALIAGFFSCPLDVIKTRLMTQNFKLEQAEQIVRQIYRQLGITGFFRGVGFRCGILSFGGIIYFGALQQARISLGLYSQS